MLLFRSSSISKSKSAKSASSSSISVSAFILIIILFPLLLKMYENTEYLSEVAASVRNSLEEMESLILALKEIIK